MAAITSAQSGNWSATSTWVGGVVPGNGDTVTLNHAVTVDVDTTVGTSPAAGTVVLEVASGGGGITISGGVTLKIRGDFHNFGAFELLAGAVLEFDSSQSVDPANTSYEFRYAKIGSTTTIKISGTPENRCQIRSNPGGKNAFVNSISFALIFWDEANCDWYRMGGSGTYAVYIRMGTHAVGKYVKVNGTTYDSFDKSVYVLANDPSNANTDIEFDRLWFRNGNPPVYDFYPSVYPSLTAKRKLTNSWFEKQLSFSSAYGVDSWDLSGSIFSKINFNAPTYVAAAAGASNCTIIDTTGSSGPIGLGVNNDVDFEDLLVVTHVAALTHQEGIINGAGFSINGCVWDGGGQVPEAPILTSPSVNTTSAHHDVDIKNVLALPNPKGSGIGMICEMKGSKYTRVTMENVTAAAGASDYEWGLIKSSWGSNSRGFAGHIVSVKNILFWNPSGNDSDLAFIIDNVRTEAVRTGTAGASSTTTVLYSNQLLTGVSSGEGSYYVKMTSGPDAGLMRAVSANDATTVTVAEAFPNSMANYTYELFPLDQVTSCDYNAFLDIEADGSIYDSSNVLSRSSVTGYTGIAQTNPAAIGAHDISLSSLAFVDPSRNIYRWATAESGLGRPTSAAWETSTSYGIGDSVSRAVSGFYAGDTLNYRCIKPHTSSSSDAPGGFDSANWRTYWVPEGLYLIIQAKLQRSGYVEAATQANFLSWVRAGWSPLSATLLNAGYDGGYIGAVQPVNPDSTAPVLSSLFAVATGTTTATLTVTTDEASGDAFVLLDSSPTATEDAILAGLSQSVTVTGEQEIYVTALDHNTTYYAHVLHRDAAGNVSNILDSEPFRTLDLSITLDFPDAAPCSLLGYQVWSKLTVTDEEIAALWEA